MLIKHFTGFNCFLNKKKTITWQILKLIVTFKLLFKIIITTNKIIIIIIIEDFGFPEKLKHGLINWATLWQQKLVEINIYWCKLALLGTFL